MEEEIRYDEHGEKYSTCSLFNGLSKYVNMTAFGDGGGLFMGNIGSGSRAELARSLGFSEHPSEAECSAQMRTINIDAYPGRKITVHRLLVGEVQSIFRQLRSIGVNLNPYIGGYCYRKINNPNDHRSNRPLSTHSFGAAIDINYNVNKFIGGGRPLTSGDDTANGVIRTLNSPIVKIFAAHGWGWGGRYGDYMHFSKANGS